MRWQLISWAVSPIFLSLNPILLPAYSQSIVSESTQQFFHQGCLAGYPDGTFRGEKPVSRYEFIAALSACLEAIPHRSQSDISSEELLIRADQLEEYRQQLNQLHNQLDQLAPELENSTP